MFKPAKLALAGTLCSSLLLVLVVVGCATIMKGSKQSVSVNSTPAAAKVVVKRLGTETVLFEGTTPATTKLAKNAEYVVTVSLEGYKPVSTNITKEGIEGWFWGNLICGGLIGIVVDASDGAINKIGPSEINVTLQTAYVPGGDPVYYAVFLARDSQGQLRNFALPLSEEVEPSQAASGQGQ